MQELETEELECVAGGRDIAIVQTGVDFKAGNGILTVRTTTHYTDRGNYVTTTAIWTT